MALSTTRRLPIEQNVGDLVEEAKHRWLKAGEIFMILHNYKELQILASRRLHRPPSGSLFVIEPQRLREFKKDGYEWSKKKYGKTIQEAHENLKVKGFETLECLYAHLEINDNFQRRIYRWIDKKTVNSVLLHYLQNKESRKDNKRSRKNCPSDIVHHESFQLVPDYENPNFHGVIEDDFPRNPSTTVTPCKLPELESVEEFSKCFHERFEYLLSVSCFNYNIAELSLEKKFHLWLKKLAESGDGPTVLAVEMMHLSAALGYTPALQAMIGAAKIDINSSDKNGFTALHWAAKFGRMHTVEFLIFEGAAPGLLSISKDNTLADLASGLPSTLKGDTPADLAYAAGYHKIGDYLERKVELTIETLEFHTDEYFDV